MKIQKILLAIATVMLLTTSSAWAERGGESKPHTTWYKHVEKNNPHIAWYQHGHWFGQWFRHVRGHWFKHEHGHWFNHDHDHGHGHGHGHGLIKVPEIDATSGTSAIALVTGVLLLAGERTRSRRS